MKGGGRMTDYRVAITETRRRVVTVAASSEREAHGRAMDAWRNGEVVMDAEDFEGVEAYVVGEGDAGKKERIEAKGGEDDGGIS